MASCGDGREPGSPGRRWTIDRATRSRLVGAVCFATACAVGLLTVGSAQTSDDHYPADITPPPGTRYPCALTALPPGLPGIPEGDRAYINRTYARILRATQAKLLALKALEDGRDVAAALARFDSRVAELVERTRSEPAPSGLGPFQQDIVSAFELQRRFFAKAGPVRLGGGSMGDVYAIPEGRQASGRLIAAWGKMQARYRGWDAATRDSVYHHLCALDLF